MKIISWNVAGFRAVLNKGFDEFFKSENADVYCLQESKVLKDQFDYSPEGYEMYLNPAEKKGYAGTLVFSKVKPINVTYGMGIPEHDNEGRIITLEFKDYYLINMYVPNVKRDLSRLDYRMTWEEDFKKYVKSLERINRLLYVVTLMFVILRMILRMLKLILEKLDSLMKKEINLLSYLNQV